MRRRSVDPQLSFFTLLRKVPRVPVLWTLMALWGGRSSVGASPPAPHPKEQLAGPSLAHCLNPHCDLTAKALLPRCARDAKLWV